MAFASSAPIGAETSWAERIEALLAGIAIVMMTSPALQLLGNSYDPAAPENPTMRLFWIPPYLIALGLSAFRARRLTRYWIPLILALAVVGWAYASKYWSIDPETTGRRVFALAMTSLLGFYLGAAYDDRRFVLLIAGSFLALSVGSVLMVFLLPRYGVDHSANSGDWRGVWGEKNTLALFMVLAVVSALSALMVDPGRRWLWGGMLGLCLLLLVMSKGKTALLCVMLSLAAMAGVWLMRRGRILGVVTAWGLVTVG